MTMQSLPKKCNTPQSLAPFYPPSDKCNQPIWEITVYHAANDPERWLRFNRRAKLCCTTARLGYVAKLQKAKSNLFDTYFAEATVVGTKGRKVVVGGINLHAVNSDGDVPLYAELADHLGEKILRSYVTRICSPSLCQTGGLWRDPRFINTGLTADLAYACVPMMLAVNATWSVAVAQAPSIDAWASLGWHKLKRFPYFSYPDSRHESAIILGSIASWPVEVKQWANNLTEHLRNESQVPQIPFTVDPFINRNWG